MKIGDPKDDDTSPVRVKGALTTRLATMNVGQSIDIVSGPEDSGADMMNNVRSACTRVRKKSGNRFSIYKTVDGCKIWRVG